MEGGMRNCRALENHTMPRVRLIAFAPALAVAFAVALPKSADADRVTPPPAPANIRVPAGNKAFLDGHAEGTQDYICLASGQGFVWTFFGPQATLFDDEAKQLITHFLSPNPFETGTARATWQHSKDTSAVWAAAIASSSDSAFVAPGAIPWLLLQVVGEQIGPTGGHRLTATTFIQRLNTAGGTAPSTGCAVPTDVGKKALVPYAADYIFYKDRERDLDHEN
jgi:uncharacterized protein DUF3455